MKIIVVGLGQTGRLLTEVISKEHYDVVVVDSNKEVVEEITEKYNVTLTIKVLPMESMG